MRREDGIEDGGGEKRMSDIKERIISRLNKMAEKLENQYPKMGTRMEYEAVASSHAEAEGIRNAIAIIEEEML